MTLPQYDVAIIGAGVVGCFLAGVLGRPVAVPGSADVTALGAAQLAMIGAGLCDIDSLPAAPAERRPESGEPPLPAQARERFRSAVGRCANWC